MAEKFIAFKIPEGFVDETGKVPVTGELETRNSPEEFNLVGATLFTEETAKAAGIDLEDTTHLIRIPISQEVQDDFDLTIGQEFKDTAPEVANTSETLTGADIKKLGDNQNFIAFDGYGFYDVKGGAENARLKQRDYAIDYATAFNTDTYEAATEKLQNSIGAESFVVPITDSQMKELATHQEFAQYQGFFFDTQRDVQEYGISPDDPDELNLDLSGLEEIQENGLEQ